MEKIGALLKNNVVYFQFWVKYIFCVTTYRTKAACEEDCMPSNRCELPISEGPCVAGALVYGFRNGKCEQFHYGGCQGNANRFK